MGLDLRYSRNGIELYCGRAEELAESLAPTSVDLVLTDPPYGIKENTRRGEKRRGGLVRSNDFSPIIGDDKDFDPTFLLKFRRVALFGANYYAQRLPPSPSWIVWDKREWLRSVREVGFNDNADCEMVWTNLGGPARILSHRWMGALKESERREPRIHPTQKPVALLAAIIRWRTKPEETVADFYAGSGSTLVACAQEGRRGIASEIDPHYCDAIVSRMEDLFEQWGMFAPVEEKPAEKETLTQSSFLE